MTHIGLKSVDEGIEELASHALQQLRAGLRGVMLLPDEPGYEDARAIWNAMVDRRPAVIVRAAGAADVIRAIGFAREHRLSLSVRGGGHNIAGHAVRDGGLMLDLSMMRSIQMDPAARIARVEPGATLGDFDREALAFGFATPLGINSTTGVSGITLGGGFGWISRKFGLTVDNLIAVDIVTADGSFVRANERENADLFWAVRGGGGNFGVVTSFEYRLHPVGPEVLAGLVVHPFADAKGLLEGYRRFAASAPDHVTAWVVARKAPPLPFLPPEVHGTPVLVFAMCAIGDLEAAERALAPLRALGTPLADVVGPVPFAEWQTAFDPLLTSGARNYWKSHSFESLEDGLIEVIRDAVDRLPTPESEVFIAQLGGAINRVPAHATAYPHRNIEFVMNLHVRWRDPAQDQVNIDWAREIFEAAAPFATGGVYVNFMPEDESARVRAGAFGANYERLARLKAKYDPTNVFRNNQNIAPAA